MRIKSVLLMLALMVVAACSTEIEHRKIIPYNHQGTLKISDMEVSFSGPEIPGDAATALQQAIHTELAKRPEGSRLVSLKLDIRSMYVVGNVRRFFVGAFAGSNTMTVGVKVIEGKKGIVADFDVVRTANPGGYGAYFDQEGDVIREVAVGIVKTLYGES